VALLGRALLEARVSLVQAAAAVVARLKLGGLLTKVAQGEMVLLYQSLVLLLLMLAVVVAQVTGLTVREGQGVEALEHQTVLRVREVQILVAVVVLTGIIVVVPLALEAVE
jgi:hypothetical protein